MPAGSSWERGRRREKEEGRGEKVGTDTKFFPRETWFGGGRAVEKKGENDTEKRKRGKRGRGRATERQRERIKVLSDIHM